MSTWPQIIKLRFRVKVPTKSTRAGRKLGGPVSTRHWGLRRGREKGVGRQDRAGGLDAKYRCPRSSTTSQDSLPRTGEPPRGLPVYDSFPALLVATTLGVPLPSCSGHQMLHVGKRPSCCSIWCSLPAQPSRV